MTKYIHYTKRHSMGVLISNNVDESNKGYSLGLEIECGRFDEVVKCMMVNQNIPLTIENCTVTNENLCGFKNEFIRCMDILPQFSFEKYSIRVINENNTVTWYRKETLPRL